MTWRRSAAITRLHSFIENSADAISLFTPKGKLIYGSPVITRILGYDLEEVRGHNPLTLIHPEDRRFVSDRLAESIANPGKLVHVGARLRHKDGSWRELEGVITNLLADPGVGGIVANYRD